MAGPQSLPVDLGRRVVRFGSFEVDPTAHQLRKNGIRIKLQEQPFRLLSLLISRPGELVPRQEMIRHLWPDGTFVDFDHGLAKAIEKLRDALGDDPEQPRFIETVPKLGYRFIASVEQMAPPVQATVTATTPAVRRYRIAAAVVLLAVIVVGGGWLIRSKFWEKDSASRNHKTISAAPLTALPGTKIHASLAPDATRVAFGWNGGKGNNFGIYVKLINADSDALLQLTHGAGQGAQCECAVGDIDSVWSPDGSYVAFLRQGVDNAAIYVVPALGGAERKLADLGPSVPGPIYWIDTFKLIAWSPDGKQLAIPVVSAETFTLHIELLSLGDLKLHPLTYVAAPYKADFPAAFSPDSKTLYLTRLTTAGAEVFSIPVDGGSPRQLTHDNVWVAGADVTPDGRSLVIASHRLGSPTAALWLMHLQSGSFERLTSGTEFSTSPSVAGHNLVFTARHGRNNHIWRADSDGHQSQVVQSTASESDVDLSPDGMHLTFRSTLGSGQIWFSNADGTQPTQLTHFQDGTHVGTPRWSPDGKLIAFDGRVNGKSEIWIASVEGGLPKTITNDPADDVVPVWSNDGNWVYFGSNRTGRWEVWKTSLASGKTTQVTHDGGFTGFESPDGKDFYYGHFETTGAKAEPIFKMSLSTGKINPVNLSARWDKWRLRKDGIYVLALEGKPAVIKYDFATKRVRKIVDLESPTTFDFGFAISPTARTFFYTRSSTGDNELMIARNWDH